MDAPPAGITQKVVSTENFVVVRVDGKMVSIEAKTPAGETIDTVELGKEDHPAK